MDVDVSVETYYKPEYDDLLDSLGDVDTLEVTVQSVKDTVDTVSYQFAAAKTLLEELQGEFTGELYGSIASLIDEIDAAYYLINENLAPTITKMKSLNGDIESLKSSDTVYKSEKTEYSTLKTNVKNLEGTLERRELTPEEESRLRQWKSNLNSIVPTLLKVIDMCEKLQGSCDASIDTIDEFNNAVVDLRLKLVALVVAQGDMPIEDVQNMSLDEKQAYLQDLLDRLKSGYEAAKLAYTAAMDKLYDSENFETAVNFLSVLYPDGTEGNKLLSQLYSGVGVTDMWSGWDDQAYIATGQFLPEFIEWYMSEEFNGKPLHEMMDAYLNGASLEESGLFDLYKANQKISKGDYYWDGSPDENFMAQFYRDLDMQGMGMTEDQVRSSFATGMQEIQSTSDEFNDQYTQHVAKGLMYKSVLTLKNELPYDEIRQSDSSYRDYVYDPELFEDKYATPGWVNDGWVGADGETHHGFTAEQSRVIDFINGENKLTDNEKKMLGYLFSTGKYEEAANYVGIIENGINRRTGEIKAERTYNKWLEGSNEGLDLLWDNARAWGKGVVDGGYDYFDSFGDIIDPNATPTAKDYEIMRMQELLSQPVYKVGSRYYSSGQIDSAMASIGFHPMGSSPTDGYTNATEASIGFQYGEMEIMPENTLWDESVKTSYGIGFKVVENSVKAVTKAIHPVLGMAVDTAHSFGKARETAEQAAYMEQVDLSTSTLDGVDYEEFWKEQAPQLAKAGISIGGNYWQPLKDAGTLISVTKTCISVPSTLDGMVDTFTHDSKAPFHEWIYDIYRSYDTVAGIVSGATGGQINISTGSLLGNGAKSAWGDESKAAKFVSKTYGTLTSYGTQYGDAFSKR